MNRFENRFLRRQKKSRYLWSVLLSVLILGVFWFGLSKVEATTAKEQEENLRSTIIRDISHCYAVEGTYPPSLSYMEEHYGLTYDKELFFVDYQPIGANLMPDLTIIRLNASED